MWKQAESEGRMEQLNALKAHLLRFPLWGEQPLKVDVREGKPEGCILFPLGLQVLARREDVLGNQVLRLRQSFLLQRAAYAGETAASWLLQLQQWLLQQPVEALTPSFGTDLRLWAEAGRMKNAKQPGTGIYEVKIYAEYEKEQENGKVPCNCGISCKS